MRNIIYIFIFFISCVNTLYATNTSSNSGDLSFSLEWIALIALAITGLIFIFRSANQIKKIRQLQMEIDTHQTSVDKELNTLGEKDV